MRLPCASRQWSGSCASGRRVSCARPRHVGGEIKAFLLRGLCRREASTTIGILRETYDPWERRAPLTPDNVKNLLRERRAKSLVTDDELKILVQPCSRRCYTDEQYEAAGATVTTDLSPAQVVFGVKRPYSRDDQGCRLPTDLSAFRGKTLVVFSHVIKGQLENMEFLQSCLENQVQLLDYERMVQGPAPNSPEASRPTKRLVAFGRFAGMAGVLDSFTAIGKRLLYSRVSGTSSPFLASVGPAWMYDSVDSAKDSVRRLGELILEEGIPVPVVLAITGQGGCVHNGAMEILTLLPHEVVPVSLLPQLQQNFQSNPNSRHRAVYLVPVGISEAFERKDGMSFDRQDFQKHPELYRSVFAKNVAPFVNVIYNCAYWDARFPRLLTKAQLKCLYERDGPKSSLFLAADISCDVSGSMEFLERTSTIESPFYQYDPALEREIAIGVGNRGVTVMGVDILPTELPKDSSDHFGHVVEAAIVPEILGALSLTEQGVDPRQLSARLCDACITTCDGQLMPGYRYLDPLMRRAPLESSRAEHDSSMTLSLEGHLFDSGLINHILNVVEQHRGSLQFEKCLIPPLEDARTSKSTALVKIKAGDDADLHAVYGKIQALVDVIPKADASLRRVDLPPLATPGQVVVQEGKKEQRILLLGAGHVAEALVEYLGRSSHIRITVASEDVDSARRVSSACRNGKQKHVAVDVCNDPQRLSSLVGDSELVVSLLPAPLHPLVAEECIRHRSHLVTASYESPEMRRLEPRVKEAGIIFLNEVGLDPGLDHMSAKKIVDDVHHRGGKVTLFSSVCGGLPAPEVARSNPFQYKFSWNPRGVIRACQNDARYRWEEQIHEVHGSELLRSAAPFVEAWPDLSLECIPNRDSLVYESAYNICDAQTIFRGTLRFRGFSALMNVFQGMGLFGSERASGETFDELLHQIRMRRGGFSSLQDYVEACADDDPLEAQRAWDAIEWLDRSSRIRPGANVVDAFCSLLESKLQYGQGERDMVLMHHRIEAEFENETHEKHVAGLLVFGDANASAMAKTVGYTTAASAELILGGLLQNQRGLLLPTSEQIYLPVLAMVAREGILFDERVSIHTSPVERSA